MPPAPPTIRAFKAALASLRRSKRFIECRASGDFAHSLSELLQQLADARPDPRVGAECVLAFYRTDSATLGRADDSNGSIGDVYRIDASDAFARYAAACGDKGWIIEQVLELLATDDYGVRDSVLARVGEYLPEPQLRELVARLWEAAGGPRRARTDSERDWSRSGWYLLIATVATQLRDPELFEQARRSFDPALGVAACLEIAEAWLHADDAARALTWLDRVASDRSHHEDRRDELLRRVHARLGNRTEVERLAWEYFRGARSTDALDDLLAVVGADRREEVIDGASAEILANPRFEPSHASFLLEQGRAEAASSLVLARCAQLDGDQWSQLAPLAEEFEADGSALAASLVYRALLDSILRRAESRTYGHGARYLRRLQALAPRVADWRGVAPHADYVAEVRTKHARKASFWRRYEAERWARPARPARRR